MAICAGNHSHRGR